jgi:hypothetical protein
MLFCLAMRVTMEEQTQLLKFFVSSSFSAMCENLEKDMPARVKVRYLFVPERCGEEIDSKSRQIDI